MDEILKNLIPFLEKEEINYRGYSTRIRVPLPNDFGELEIGDLEKGDTIVGLVDEIGIPTEKFSSPRKVGRLRQRNLSFH